MINSPLAWLRGKHRMRKHLLSIIPEHICYIELFGGGGTLLLAKEPSRVEIYNDINEMLVKFFRIIRLKEIESERYQRFLHFCKWIPYSRVEFFNCRATWEDESDPELQIAKWYNMIRMAFRSKEESNSWTVDANSNRAVGLRNHIENFDIIGNRLKAVQIECKDWRILFDRYDTNEDVFFYLDPPYLPSARKGGKYIHEMDEQDHIELIDRLKSAKSKVLLSGYPSELYDSLDWNRKEFDALTCLNSHQLNADKRRRTEVLWYNYDLQNEKSLFD